MPEFDKSQPIMVIDNEDAWLDEEVKRNVWTGPFDKAVGLVDSIYNWGRRSSIWPMQFGLACCAIEMICAGGARYDIARFGAELFRPSPRQADLMIVAGTVTKKMVPAIVRLYNQMAEPKYVMAMGACATAGGPFKEGYNVVSGIDKFLPVDVYVPGCPPTPQALLHGLISLQKKIDAQSVRAVPWYQAESHQAIPEPVYGPDLFDPRRATEIKALTSDPEKQEALYVHIAARAEIKHGKKEGEPEAKEPAKQKPAAVAGKTAAPAEKAQTPKPGIAPGKEAPKANPVPKSASAEANMNPPATKDEAGTGGSPVNPRTVNRAEPASTGVGEAAPIEAAKGEVRPIPPAEPDRLMLDRKQNPPGTRKPNSPAIPGLPTATPENEAKLRELKADADFAAKVEQIHEELAKGDKSAVELEEEEQAQVRATMENLSPGEENLQTVEPTAGQSKDAEKGFERQIGREEKRPESRIIPPSNQASGAVTEKYRAEGKEPEASRQDNDAVEGGGATDKTKE